MEPLSRLSGARRAGQLDRRRYPLNPNGHFTTNLLIGFRHRPRTQTKISQDWAFLEPHLTSPNVLEHNAARTSESDGVYEVIFDVYW
jgi:hypothetical protein